VDYTDLETDEDFMTKARAIIANEEYDTRISVPVDFTDEEILRYAKLAHEQDITLNQFIEQALREFLEYHKLPKND
jgi:predicted HicB family RNase H-like nuclease